METKQSPWRHQLVIYLIVEVVPFIIISAIWWFSGEHSVTRFSNICFLVGAAVMLVGFFIFQGSRGTTGSFGYQYAQTSNPDRMYNRVTRDWKERFANEMQILVFIGLGALPMAVGILASKIWG